MQNTMKVDKINGGTPVIIHSKRISPYKPSSDKGVPLWLWLMVRRAGHGRVSSRGTSKSQTFQGNMRQPKKITNMSSMKKSGHHFSFSPCQGSYRSQRAAPQCSLSGGKRKHGFVQIFHKVFLPAYFRERSKIYPIHLVVVAQRVTPGEGIITPDGKSCWHSHLETLYLQAASHMFISPRPP